jgi:hypothetical protein
MARASERHFCKKKKKEKKRRKKEGDNNRTVGDRGSGVNPR